MDRFEKRMLLKAAAKVQLTSEEVERLINYYCYRTEIVHINDWALYYKTYVIIKGRIFSLDWFPKTNNFKAIYPKQILKRKEE